MDNVQTRHKTFGDCCIADTSSNISIINKERLHIEIYPNPAQSNFTLEYKINKLSNVNIRIVNTLGKTEKTIKDGIQSSGSYLYRINTSTEQLKAGIYFIRFEANNQVFYKKIIITG